LFKAILVFYHAHFVYPASSL